MILVDRISRARRTVTSYEFPAVNPQTPTDAPQINKMPTEGTLKPRRTKLSRTFFQLPTEQSPLALHLEISPGLASQLQPT